MTKRTDNYMAAVVNYGIAMAESSRVGACRYMAERLVPRSVIVRVLSRQDRRR